MDIAAYSPAVKAFLVAALALGCAQAILVCRWLARRKKKIYSKPVYISAALCAVAHAAILAFWTISVWALLIEPQWIQVNRFAIYTDKWPVGAVCRVAHLSDTHVDTVFYWDDRLINILRRIQPDIIVFTGDAVNRKETLPRFVRMLSAMEAPLGKFAVKGNWDYFWPNLFENTGFEELVLQTVPLEKQGHPLGICGIAFHKARKSQLALNQLNPKAFNILLHHSSDLAPYVDDEPVDLYLCGHTHGGQVRLPAFLRISKRAKSDYFSGLYDRGKMKVYVHRGIGMTGFAPPARFRARPEVAVFDIIGTAQ